MLLINRYYLFTADQAWHVSCLRCCRCSQNLNSELSCFSRDGLIYCKEDYYRWVSQPTRILLHHTQLSSLCWVLWLTNCIARILKGKNFTRAYFFRCKQRNEEMKSTSHSRLASFFFNGNNFYSCNWQWQRQNSMEIYVERFFQFQDLSMRKFVSLCFT